MNVNNFENRPPSCLKFSPILSTETREFLEHPLKPPIRAHPPAVLRGGGGVAAEIKTGYATLSRNKYSRKQWVKL